MDVPPPEAAFFEELLKHKPIKDVLIKQLSLLDSLTLIRLARTSLALSEFIRDDTIWAPRLKKQYGGYWYDVNPKYPNMYFSSVLYFCFPTLYDAFIYMITSKPHAWTRDLNTLSVQDWDFSINSKNCDFPVFFKQRLVKELPWWHQELYIVWTTNTHQKNGPVTDKSKGPYDDNIQHVAQNLDSIRRTWECNELSLVPRLGFWFKISLDKKDISFIPTLYQPSRKIRFDAEFYFTIRYFKNVEKHFRLHDNKLNVLEKQPKNADVVFFGYEHPKRFPGSGQFSYTVIFNKSKKEISIDFSVCFFVNKVVYQNIPGIPALAGAEAYRVTVDASPEKNILEMLKKRFDRNVDVYSDTVLKIEEFNPYTHKTTPEQFEFNIETCLVCGQPSQLKCSECHRASFCSEECGQQSWSDNTHASVCKILKN